MKIDDRNSWIFIQYEGKDFFLFPPDDERGRKYWKLKEANKISPIDEFFSYTKETAIERAKILIEEYIKNLKK